MSVVVLSALAKSSHLIFTKKRDVGTTIALMLQVRELGLREDKSLAPGFTMGEQKNSIRT